MKKRININLMTIPALAFTLWLGFTGRVDWWVISLFVVYSTRLDFSYGDYL